MRRLLSLFLAVLMVMTLFSSVAVYADDSIKVVIDGVNQTYDVMPVIVNDRTLVPMRGIFEALGAEINWDDATKTVVGTKGDVKVTLTIGNNVAKVGDTEVTLDSPATIVSDRTMVPVRFISEAMGCKVNWIADTRTVDISSKTGMATLKSDFHRAVPVTFEKSNALDDLYFFPQGGQAMDEIFKSLQGAKEIYSMADLKERIKNTGEQFGSMEFTQVDGKEVLRITTTSVPETLSKAILKDPTAFKDRFNGGDLLLFTFKLRTVSGGGEDGKGKIQIQVEHPETYQKMLFEYASAASDWEQIYLPLEGKQDHYSMGIRFGFFAPQVVEISDFQVLDFAGTQYTLSDLPMTGGELYPELDEGAEWRTQAFKDIEANRKGDFSVVVKDASGNVIPNAEVEFDMFEHEYQFGASAKTRLASSGEYSDKFGENFNTMVVEHTMKWGPYEEDTSNPKEARRTVDGAKAVGVKYFRGHTLIWERDLSSSGTSYLTPAYMFEDEMLLNRPKFDATVEAFIKEMCEAFPEMDDWDVVNELTYYDAFRQKVGDEAMVQWFDWARKYSQPGTVLYYNETHGVWEYQDEFWGYLDFFKENNVDIDAIGIQSHNNAGRYFPQPTEVKAMYDRIANEYGLKLKVTEFSCSRPDANLQAAHMRDLMIVTFAHPASTGFLMWDFWDGGSFSAYAPLYTTDWQLKKAGQVYQDLVYNKWWTKDAKATTDAEGKATVRGFYGDYDVTVNANGKTKTVSCAYHKGYDNVLEIVVE